MTNTKSFQIKLNIQKQIERVDSKNSVATYQPVPTGPPAAATNFNYWPRINNQKRKNTKN